MKPLTLISKLHRMYRRMKGIGIREWLYIYFPHANYNCLGISITPLFYMDIYESWGSRGIYIRFWNNQKWIPFSRLFRHRNPITQMANQTLDLWFVRFIKDDTYHPIHKGFIVKAWDVEQAIRLTTELGIDWDEGGEYQGYELTAEIVEFNPKIRFVAEL